MQAPVELGRLGTLGFFVELCAASPPASQRMPRQSRLAEREVVNEAVFRVLGDFDDVADRVSQDDLWLGPFRGEDQVLHVTGDTTCSDEGEQVREFRAVMLLVDRARQGD